MAGKTKLLFHSLLFLILFFGLISLLETFKGRTVYLELLGLGFLLLLSLVGYVGYAQKWGERVFFFVYLFYLVNLILMWYFLGSLYLVLVVLALLGFWLSLPSAEEKEKKPAKVKKEEEPHSEVYAPLPPVKKKEEMVEAAAVKTSAKEKPQTKFTPGKYVASKMGNTYHLPKCEWAKKIAKSRRVWFASQEDAWEQKYKAHSCITE